ncbi:FecR family protein [Magnetococcales bacterium HHB-1]
MNDKPGRDGGRFIGHLLLVSLLLLVGIQQAFAKEAAGRVLVAVGDVKVIRVDGKEEALSRGSLLMSGDKVVTTDGQAQVLFTDRSLMSLFKDTVFEISDYRFGGSVGEDERARFDLQGGVIHALTGKIANKRSDHYSVKSPMALIGVKGTRFAAKVRDNLHVSVASGIVSLTNQTGTMLIGAGENALVANFKSAPKLIPKRINLNSHKANVKAQGPGVGGSSGQGPGGVKSDKGSPGDGGMLGPGIDGAGGLEGGGDISGPDGGDGGMAGGNMMNLGGGFGGFGSGPSSMGGAGPGGMPGGGGISGGARLPTGPTNPPPPPH